MWSIVAVVAFAIALLLRVAEVSRGVWLTWETFVIVGLLARALAQLEPGWPWKRSSQ